MKTMFEDLMTGLDEVETFLDSRGDDYKVQVPAHADDTDALQPESAEE